MLNRRRLLALLAVTPVLARSSAAHAAPADEAADKLDLVSLVTRQDTGADPAETIPFQAVVNYQLQSTSNGFLLVVVFENNATSSTSQNSAKFPIQSGSGQATLNLDYPVHAGVRTLTLMIAMFKTEQKLLTWVSTTPIDLAPWPGRAAFDKAMAARLAQDYAMADRYLSEAIQASPDTGNYYYWRGDTRIYLQQYAAAIDDFSHSLTLMPDDRASRVGHGVGLLWNGDAQSALADLNLVIDAHVSPDRLTAFAFRARGTAYASLDQPAQAVSDYQAYLALLPDAPDRSQVESWISDLT